MRLLRIAPALLLILTAFGCGVNRRLTAPTLVEPEVTGAALNRGLGTALFTQNNGAAGNSVLAWERRADGTLVGPVATPTGGSGSGAGLGSQGSVVVSAELRTLFVVDAGSNDVAAFRITPAGLHALGTTPSGGQHPISIAIH